MKPNSPPSSGEVPAPPSGHPTFRRSGPRIALFDSEPPCARARVLVADDNIDATIGLATFLDVLGHDVRTAYDGAAALDIARHWHPDALFLDLAMPSLDGNEVCSAIRQEPWAKEALIVAVTGFGRPEDRRASRAAGFDRHLVKPVDPSSIDRLLRRHRAGGLLRETDCRRIRSMECKRAGAIREVRSTRGTCLATLRAIGTRCVSMILP